MQPNINLPIGYTTLKTLFINQLNLMNATSIIAGTFKALTNNDIFIVPQYSEIDLENRSSFYIVLEMINSHSYANPNASYTIDNTGEILSEHLGISTFETWAISLCSKDYTALQQTNFVSMACASTEAEALMEQNGIGIKNGLTDWKNASEKVGAGILSRYEANIFLNISYTSTNVIPSIDLTETIQNLDISKIAN